MGKKEIKEIKKKLKAKRADAKAKPQEEKTAAEKKRKPKYGFLSCVGYMLGFIWRADKKLAVFAVALIPITIIMSALGLFVPPQLIDIIGSNSDFSYVALVIFGLMSVIGIFTLISSLLRTFNDHSKNVMADRMSYILKEKEWNLDYFYWLDPECQKKMNRAWGAWGGLDFFNNFSDIAVSVANFFLYSAVISTLHPVIILVLIVRCVINFLVGLWANKKNYEIQDERQLAYKRVNYLAYNVSNDLSYGKDIRLYGLAGYLMLLAKKLTGEVIDVREIGEGYYLRSSIVHLITTLISDGFCYAVLISAAANGTLSPSQFLLYISAISTLGGLIANFLWTWSGMQENAMHVSDFREFLEVERAGRIDSQLNAVLDRPLSIEFKNVTFKYPEGEKNVIENVSFKIEAGERIALVGLNGSGKTTLTYLMCGLLAPTEGEVLIDGHSTLEYNRDDLYTMFSLIPQQYHLFPYSIAQNIALADIEGGEEIDYEKLNRCIAFAGLEEKIAALEKGVETPLNRQIYHDAVELSGGETQKLLLARALYRTAPIMLLDEPTAALDPISEDRMYHKYNEIENTTSIFISHRLASTRFCDRVFFLDGAHIAETGTHEELIERGGKYKEIFDVQAKYYKEGENDGENQE